MWPVGWEALEQWGDDVVRIQPLTGGVGVNELWSVRVNGHLAVGRLGQRSDADLAWETDRDRSRLAPRRRHTPPAASVYARLAPAPGLAVVDRPSARRDRDEGRP